MCYNIHVIPPHTHMSTHRQHFLTVVFLATALGFIVTVKQVQEASVAASATHQREAARTQADSLRQLMLLRGSAPARPEASPTPGRTDLSRADQKAALKQKIERLTNEITMTQTQVERVKATIHNGNTGVSAVKAQATVDSLMQRVRELSGQLSTAQATLDAPN